VLGGGASSRPGCIALHLRIPQMAAGGLEADRSHAWSLRVCRTQGLNAGASRGSMMGLWSDAYVAAHRQNAPVAHRQSAPVAHTDWSALEGGRRVITIGHTWSCLACRIGHCRCRCAPESNPDERMPAGGAVLDPKHKVSAAVDHRLHRLKQHRTAATRVSQQQRVCRNRFHALCYISENAFLKK
jgi:hypothetical protein